MLKPKIIWRGAMYHGTSGLHHYIEKHTVLGRIMHNGNPTPEQYAGWLAFKARFFDGIERHIPSACRRADLYRRDLTALGIPEPKLLAAEAHIAWMQQPGLSETECERRLTGTAYVCVGSVFGASEIRALMQRRGMTYPVESLGFQDQPTELSYLRQLRHRGDCLYEAMQTFDRMVACCEEITGELV